MPNIPLLGQRQCSNCEFFNTEFDPTAALCIVDPPQMVIEKVQVQNPQGPAGSMVDAYVRRTFFPTPAPTWRCGKHKFSALRASNEDLTLLPAGGTRGH